MQISLVVAAFTLLFFGSIVPIVAPTAAQAEKGLVLDLRRHDPGASIIVAEYIGISMSVEIAVTNNTGATQKILKFDIANRLNYLRARIIQPDGSTLAAVPGTPPVYVPPKPEDYIDLGTGKTLRTTILVGHLGYSNVREVGEHILEVTFEPVEGTVLKQKLKFIVVTVPEKAIVRSVQLPLEREDPRTTVYVQKLRIGGEYYLYFRKFYDEKPEHAARLAEVDQGSDFVVVGLAGSREPIYVAYPHSRQGMTLLTLDSGGKIDRKITTDDKPDAAPATPK